MKIPSTPEELENDLSNNNIEDQFIKGYKEIVRDLLYEYGIINPVVPKWGDEKKEAFILNWINNPLTRPFSYKYAKALWKANLDFFEPKLSENPEPIEREKFIGKNYKLRPDFYEAIEKIENSPKWNKNWFSQLPDRKRKFLMLTDDIKRYEEYTPDISVLRISHIPDEIKFYEGKAIIDTLYLEHPYKKGFYVPLESSEDIFFSERINELSHTMSALGAVEIKAVKSHEYSSKKESINETSHFVQGGFKIFGASGHYEDENSHKKEKEEMREILFHYMYDPIKEPYLPNDLVWYYHEKDWQSIAHQRLEGNMLTHSIKISSRVRNLIQDTEKERVNIQAKALLVSAGYKFDSDSYSFFEEKKIETTQIYLKFKSRKDY